jgi:hypothetical protein
MKLKALFLVAVGAAGMGASYAVAASTKGPHDAGPACRPIHVHGTMASPSTFVITVQKAGPKNVVTTGQVLTLTVGGGTGQTVVADAESCTTGTGTSAIWTTRHVNVHVSPPHPGKTTTSP